MPQSHVCDCKTNLRLEIVLKYLVYTTRLLYSAVKIKGEGLVL